MGKQGPCCHCGVTSTPLWRNGPPEKPVLCNACGSRWRTKGTLVNYTPLHARNEPDDYENHRIHKMKSISVNKNKEVKLLKRKPNYESMVIAPDYHQGFRKAFDEDMMSNRSSSGSAISNSESCAQFGSGDASEFTGPAQSNVWDSTVPSKKRTCVNRPKQSSVEKLTKDLYTILHEQQSSYFSGSSEEDLLLESETPMIGHGSVLIRHPSSIARDEESEASSLSVENKQYSLSEAYSHSSSLNGCKDLKFPGRGTDEARNPAQGIREKSQNEKMLILGSHSSHLCNVDLNDIINFEEFTEHFTIEEQQQLLKYLPPLDISNLPYNLESIFDSPQFTENLASYQNLLKEGVFDLTHPGMKTDDCKTVKRLALGSLTKSHWVERYHTLKTFKSNSGGSVGSRGLSIVGSNTKSVCENKNPSFSESKIVRGPKPMMMKSTQELLENDGSCFSPRSLFALPRDGSSYMLDSLHFVDESSDQDLLLEVPSHSSFAEAVLLHPGLGFGHQASTSISAYPNLV